MTHEWRMEGCQDRQLVALLAEWEAQGWEIVSVLPNERGSVRVLARRAP